MPDVSEYRVLHTHSPAKKIAETGGPILDWLTFVKPVKKNMFAYIVRS